MLREYRSRISDIHNAVTACLIVASYVGVYRLLHPFLEGIGRPLLPMETYLPAIGIIAIAQALNLKHRDFNTSKQLMTRWTILGELGNSVLVSWVVFAFFAYFLNWRHFSRLYMLSGMLGGYIASAAWHFGAYAYCRKAWARAENRMSVLLVGNCFTLPRWIKLLQEGVVSNLHLSGILYLGQERLGQIPADVLCGRVSDIRKFLDTTVVDYVIFTAYRQDPTLIEEAMLVCRERGIEAWLAMDFMHQEVAASRVDYVQDIPLFIFSMVPYPGISILVKRGLDVVLSGFLLAVLALPMLAAAWWVRMTSEGPALFKQRRIGLNGREFLIYKLRSMYLGAEKRQVGLKNEQSGPAFKMAHDPRITPAGRFLRKYSIDELPQLFNVLLGEMSLVGPRPLPTEETRHVKGWQRRRLSMRPGITGLWQVMGRNNISNFGDWARLDLKYIDTWTLWLDLKILLETAVVVLRGTGL